MPPKGYHKKKTKPTRRCTVVTKRVVVRQHAVFSRPLPNRKETKIDLDEKLAIHIANTRKLSEEVSYYGGFDEDRRKLSYILAMQAKELEGLPK